MRDKNCKVSSDHPIVEIQPTIWVIFISEDGKTWKYFHTYTSFAAAEKGMAEFEEINNVHNKPFGFPIMYVTIHEFTHDYLCTSNMEN